MGGLKGKIIFSLALIALVVILGFTMEYKSVTIKVDGQEIQSITSKRTVGEVLAYKGIVLQPDDYISESLQAPITAGMTIEIIRSFPVIIEVDSKTIIQHITANTAANILMQAGIELGELDKVTPQLDTEIVQPQRIKVTRVVEQTEVLKEVIPKETEYKEDSNLDKGVTKVVKEGKDGERVLIYHVTVIDGQEDQRVLVEEKILSQPVNRVVAKGVRDRVTIGTVSRSYRTAVTMVATAYTHTGNPTFTGVMPKRGTVAVDPNVIPLGREVFVEGYGLAVAQDIGSSIKGNRIDVFMDTLEEARKWGRKTVKVYILD
ncbi:3D domain-containing protein [Desulfitibacter alkalitolerans]|uniref:3D domain-containing protein n=1 Tax=Desulfitibacter alkalitolerans TaxID=264641 RepID=UPI00048878B0|nr:3D domain-containing protein [Desulfitibacter alkalitolerans]